MYTSHKPNSIIPIIASRHADNIIRNQPNEGNSTIVTNRFKLTFKSTEYDGRLGNIDVCSYQ